ncbi:alanine racemase [Serpentinicella alkaliphila]|uniref:Alanine racemase n=1 Tax=Serpentinicella alkaliphila TaxID=1734049 RepID=A0A4R2TUC9_9FIRM|nr:alanine racemase [Serpentinicella alkaliphila]QUH25663.1 alanine racemase [Serpentinicella alkaliphila]TCQ06626.1 alanine racemase [Serpentinicella alkaliphila]
MFTNKHYLRPTWAEINLDNLKYNIKALKKLIGDKTEICAVVKADAYGHGSTHVAKVFVESGINILAVATLTEAIELRKSGCDVSIIILGYTPIDQGDLLLEYDIIQTIYSYDQAIAFAKIAKEMNKELTIHIKVDTGMSRLGFQISDKDAIKSIFNMENLKVQGLYTHFALADERDKTFTYEQFNRFNSLVNELESEGYQIPIKHCSNSAAVIDLPEMNLDMVRAGIMLYGLYPSDEVNKERINLKPVMALKTTVSHVKTVQMNQGVSYGHRFVTNKTTKIATLPVGYADGISRLLTNKMTVTYKGTELPVIGTICMDQCMVDASSVDIKVGDEVIIFSNTQNDGHIVDDLAKQLGTINYEIICMLGTRVPRVYLEDNNVVHIRDILLK